MEKMLKRKWLEWVGKAQAEKAQREKDN